MTTEINFVDVLAGRDLALADIRRIQAQAAADLAEHVQLLCDCETFITANLDKLGVEQVLARRFSLEDDATSIPSPGADVLKALKASQEACATHMHTHLTSKNLQNMKLAAGPMAFLQKGSSCGILDWESVLDSIVNVVPAPDGVTEEMWTHYLTYLRAQGNWQLLKKDVNKTAVAEVVDATGVAPDGVKFERFQTVQFRRGKA